MSEDDRDTPIEAQDFLGGVTIVDIGDIRITRGLSRRPFSICRHRKLIYDLHERRIWCSDCEHDVEAFDAFLALIEPYDRSLKELEGRQKMLAQVEQFKARTLAGKAIDEAWRRKSVVPSCPHCRGALLPEHFKNGCVMVDKPLPAAQR